jgi:hypothetical protein
MTVERPAFLTLGSASVVAGTLELFPGDALNLSVGVTGALANSGNVTFQKLQPGNKWGNLTASGGTQSRVYSVLSASEAEEGYYRVSATGVVNGVVYSNVVKVNVHDPIAFTATKVSNVVATEGEVFTLTAPVVGYAPTYQWKLNGVNIEVPGGTLSSYTSAASVLSAGTYSVLVRNYKANGEEFSSKAMEVAQVRVNAKPNVTMLGSVVRVDEGGTLSVVGSVSGTPGEVRYQWRKDGKPLVGAGVSGVAYVTAGGSASVQYKKTTGVSALDEGHYDLVAANAFGVATGPLERVEVFARPRFVETPGKANVEDVVALSGSDAVFRVNAVGSGTLKYQWYRSPSATGGFVEYPNASGSDTSALTVTGAALVDGSRYYVEVKSVSDVSGTTLSSGSSSIATLRVSDKSGLLSVGSVRLNGGMEAASAALSLVGGNALYATAKAVNPGSLKLSYQWRRNGESLAGGAGTVGALVAGGSEFALVYALPARLDASSDGVYDVVVDNGAGVAVSPSIAVTLDPKIIAVDIPRMVNPSEAVKLSATVAGTLSSYRYKWIRDGVVMASGSVAGGLPFGIEDTGTLAAGSYQLRVGPTDALYVETAPVKVSVAAAAAIVTQPVAPARVGAGGTFALVIAATGDNLKYQWSKDGAPIAAVEGGTLAVLSRTGAGNLAGAYQVKVWNDFSMALSNVVNVSVSTELGVDVLAPELVDIGGSANLIANASGPGTLSYQWSRGGVEIAGATAETLRLSPVTAADRGQYRVRVTSSEGAVVTGTVTSLPVTLAVRDVPRILVAPLSRTVQASGTASVSFKVVAESREGNPLSYTWREAGVEGTLSATGTQNASTLNVTVGATAGTVRYYSVTVSSGTSVNQGSITLTARLNVLASGSSETKGATAGSDGVSAHTGWWVYWVKATSKSTGEVRNGYYALERELKAGESIVTPKRAVWVWEAGDAGSSVYPSDRWDAGDQSVMDGVASERGEFSVLASRTVVGGTYQAVDYTIAGRVEEEGEASLYGAPDLAEGVYAAGANEFTVELGWDMEQVYILDLIKTQDSTLLLDEVEAALKAALADALINGD